LVSAIGHEMDSPLLDLVADYRASTPTDAGKRVVPDAAAETQHLQGARALMVAAVSTRVHREQERVADLRARPVIAQPVRMLEPHRDKLRHARANLRMSTINAVARARSEFASAAASLRALSPQSTLDRGYAVVRNASGSVVTSPADVAVDDELSVRVAAGSLTARVTDIAPSD
jgi:exodeoxyribonuclease VII large subunit